MEEQLIKYDHLLEVLERYAIALRNSYQDNLIRNDRVASGKLLNTVEYEVKDKNGTYTVSLKLQDYWKWIESGRPPTTGGGSGDLRRAILDWIRVKPVLPHPDKDGKLPTPEQLAYLISRKIHMEGYEGTHDLREATDETWDRFVYEIYEAIDKDWDSALIKIFKY
jgi:hypothetical protein